MDFQGHQIFIVHPDSDICTKLVHRLRRMEYETFGFSNLDVDISVMQKDAVIFIKISDDDSWNWQSFIHRTGQLKINVKLVALGSREFRTGFTHLIQVSDESAIDPIRQYLDTTLIKGQRNFIRFGSQLASIATFNFHHNKRLYAGIIHDLSSTGMSCTFRPEPEEIGQLQVDHLNLNIHGYRASVSGVFSVKRFFFSQITHVFNFSGDISDEDMDHIYDFIYVALEKKLSLH